MTIIFTLNHTFFCFAYKMRCQSVSGVAFNKPASGPMSYLTNWRQFSCVCPVVDCEFRHNIDYFASLSITGQTREKLTSICLFSFYNNKLSNCPLSRSLVAPTSHKLLKCAKISSKAAKKTPALTKTLCNYSKGKGKVCILAKWPIGPELKVTVYLQGCLACKRCSACSLSCRYLNPYI